MSGIAPGELRHRLVLEQLQREPDEGGGFAEDWAAGATLWAAIHPLHGGERLEAERLTGRITHEVWLRFRPGVTPAMRFRKGTRVFHILSAVNPDERGRWLKCLCEEREL